MNDVSIQHLPFRRSSERRASEDSWDINRRNSDRRRLSIDWVPLFRDVDESAVNKALVDSEVLLLPAGTSLLRPGETNHNVYILLSGEIAAHLDSNLSPVAAITISAGECIGELSAIDGKPVSALILALTDARVLKLSRELFWYRLMIVPGIARNLMVTLTERMRRTNEQTLKAQREQLELIHLRKELDVAQQLQASMLPPQRPLFTERPDIEVCGFMEPASDVGGDLFDAFFIDEHHLFFCIGDVSGHGIAAALFMARTIGLLRILATSHTQPDKLLENLNDRLCIGNDTNIFVTLFCGLLNVESGKLLYSNGGHCAPILSIDGKTSQLAIPKGALIGAFAGISYSCMEYSLNPGDLLFCYTDGVTEAQNQTGEEFSENRCLKILHQADLLSLPALLDTVRQEVTRFTGLELLDDDCTMLAIRRPATGKQNSTHL
jgi:sigma-B regulation protein RsbU (phosphoserine phosphatase)